jgi:uncharacterized delta-60 repeat protein
MLDLRVARTKKPRPRVCPLVESLEGRLLLTRGLADATFNGGSALVFALDPQATPGVSLLQTVPLADGKTIFLGSYGQPGNFTGDPRFVVARLAPGGTFDTTFGSGGRVIGRVGNLPQDFVASGLAVQSDGKILVVGSSMGPISDPGPGGVVPPQLRDAAVVRLNADGSLDTSFSGIGYTTLPFVASNGGALLSSNAQKAAVASDGSIVVFGTALDTSNNSLKAGFARLKADGSLDMSFGPSGTGVTVMSIGDDAPSAFISYTFNAADLSVSGGGIVAAGTVTIQAGALSRPISDALVFRLDGSGNPVAGFGTAGVVGTDFLPAGTSAGDNTQAGANRVVLDSRGGVILLGSYGQTFSGTGSAIERFNATGAPDPIFGDPMTPGMDRSPLDGSSLTDVLIEPDGSLLLAGERFTNVSPAGNTGPALGLTHLDSNGQPDTSFGTGGTVTTPLVGNSSPLAAAFGLTSVRFDATGRVVVSGVTSQVGGLVATQRFLSADTNTIVIPPVVAPTVAAFSVTAKRGTLRTIVLTFSKAMVPGSAGSYVLVSAGRDRRFGTKDDRTLRLRVPSYNTASFTVTLTPRDLVGIGQPLEIVARSSSLVSTDGLHLAGTGGIPGSDFLGIFGAKVKASRRR